MKNNTKIFGLMLLMLMFTLFATSIVSACGDETSVFGFGKMMGGLWGIGWFLWTLLLLGLVALVWLWVVKLWKNVNKK